MNDFPSELPSEVDVVVIGAGPAGSTLSALLKKYRPQTSVLVLEKAQFPRHAVGESLILNINGILADLECADACDSAGFSRKWGVNFAWGPDRTPRRFDWKEAIELLGPGDEGERNYTWHVDRFEYDQILARQASKFGADVRHGYSVTKTHMDGDRVIGVRVSGPNGEHDVQAKWVVDAAGGAGPITKSLCGRELDDTLRNIAVWGYFEGVNWVDGLSGSRAHPRTAILTLDEGWCWVIPLRGGRTSIGFVTHLDTYRKLDSGDPESVLLDRIKALPEFDALLGDAKLVDYRETETRAFSAQEFSYTCKRVTGPGWAVTGDGGGFVDVILSTGCYLAQLHAQFLAYALVASLDGSDPDLRGLSYYDTVLQENLWAFRQVAYICYRYSSETSDWWRAGRARVAQGTALDYEDRAAFFSFLTGFQARHSLYDGALGSFGSRFVADVGEAILSDELPSKGGAYDASVERAREAVRANAIVRVTKGYDVRPFALPESGTGVLMPLCRIDFREEHHGSAESVPAAASGFGKKLYVDPEFANVFPHFDGTQNLGAIAARFHRAEPSRDVRACRVEVDRVATALLCMGLGEVVAPAADQLTADALLLALDASTEVPSDFVLFHNSVAMAENGPDSFEYSVSTDSDALWRVTHYFDVRDTPERAEEVCRRLEDAAGALGIPIPNKVRRLLDPQGLSVALQVGIGIDARPDPDATRLKLYIISDNAGGSDVATKLVDACEAGSEQAPNPHIVGLDLTRSGLLDVKVYTSLDPSRLAQIFRRPRAHEGTIKGAKNAVLHESRLLGNERKLHVAARDGRELRRRLELDPDAAPLLAHVRKVENLAGFPLEPWLISHTYRDGELEGPLTVYYHAEGPDAGKRP